MTFRTPFFVAVFVKILNKSMEPRVINKTRSFQQKKKVAKEKKST